MIATPYWVTAQLAIVPKPAGGDLLDTEMLLLREAGIDVVVSMLQKDEAQSLGLEHEETSANYAGLLFINFPVPDGSIPPDKPLFDEFLKHLEDHLASGKRIGIHCHGCIGRSPVTLASLLVRSGVPHESAWLQIASSRGCPVPATEEQREWVARHMRPNP